MTELGHLDSAISAVERLVADDYIEIGRKINLLATIEVVVRNRKHQLTQQKENQHAAKDHR